MRAHLAAGGGGAVVVDRVEVLAPDRVFAAAEHAQLLVDARRALPEARGGGARRERGDEGGADGGPLEERAAGGVQTSSGAFAPLYHAGGAISRSAGRNGGNRARGGGHPMGV